MELKLRLRVISVLFFLWFHEACSSNLDCPSPSNISPCECYPVSTRPNHYELTVFCANVESLPKLTHILRSGLCGHEISKFQLVTSHIGYLPNNLFFNVKFKHISISHTNISRFTEAERSAFYGLENVLTTLAMRKCGLVDQLRWEKIGDLEALISLDLSLNTLTEIPRAWFRHPPRNLRLLYLKGNRITDIQDKALASMYKLSVLDLSENFITTLERSMFPFPANSLAVLTLSYNQLQSLPGDLFHEMFGLKELYLDHNQLEDLQRDVFIPLWSELNTLDVSDNFLNCMCSMKWISELFPMKRLYGRCAGPLEMEGMELRSLWPWHFNCSHENQYI